jgi:hypothetical protein
MGAASVESHNIRLARFHAVTSRQAQHRRRPDSPPKRFIPRHIAVFALIKF